MPCDVVLIPLVSHLVDAMVIWVCVDCDLLAVALGMRWAVPIHLSLHCMVILDDRLQTRGRSIGYDDLG
jgi:hypothetical protein